GGTLFRHTYEAHADFDIHLLGRNVRNCRHPDADAIQLGQGWAWRGTTPCDGARVLSRRGRSLWRVWPRGPGCARARHPAGVVIGAESAWCKPASIDGGVGPVPDRRDDPALVGA